MYGSEDREFYVIGMRGPCEDGGIFLGRKGSISSRGCYFLFLQLGFSIRLSQ